MDEKLLPETRGGTIFNDKVWGELKFKRVVKDKKDCLLRFICVSSLS